MYYVLLDTNAWIYLANGTEPVKLLKFLSEESKKGSIKILVPRIVIDEWNKNKDKAVRHGAINHFKGVTDAFDRIVKLLGSRGEKDPLSFLLNEADSKTYFDDLTKKFKEKRKEIEDAVNENIALIDGIFESKEIEILNTSEQLMISAGKLALEKKAPFVKKNSFADAIIILAFLEYVGKNKVEGAMFITYNIEDFCERKDGEKLLHPDLEPEFIKTKSLFFTIVGEALNTIQKDLVSQEELNLIRENQDDEFDSGEQCINCHDNLDRYSLVHLSEVELDDQRIKAETPRNQIQLPFDGDAIKRKSDQPKYFTTLLVGNCDYCGTEHFLCAQCGSLNEVLDSEYGERKECDGCGLPYFIEVEIDRKGAEENVFYRIMADKVCTQCGEKYEEEHDELDGICKSCGDALVDVK